jgi:molybdenum cofactor cytidylyltransferase
MQFGPIPTLAAEGALLAHSVSIAERRLRKGYRLTAHDISALSEAGIAEVVVARLGPDDVHEDEAARQLGAALAGAGTVAEVASSGRVNLVADTDGVLCIDRHLIDTINTVDEAITVATHPPFTAVRGGALIATIKIIPFATPLAALTTVLNLTAAAADAAVRIAGFQPTAAGLVQTTLPHLKASVLEKTARLTAERLVAVHGRLVGEWRTAHTPAAVADGLKTVRTAGIGLLLVHGASATTDRRDVIPAGIEAAGGTVEHVGMPVDPGNLLVLGRWDNIPVLGLPGCARSPKPNGLDDVLRRLVAGLPVNRAVIAAMGVGGLLEEIQERPRPRRPATPARRIGAIILAAGSSRRMGANNKLLLPLDGMPLLMHIVDAVLASGAIDPIVVTGHQDDAVRAALANRAVRFVYNPAHADGIGGSVAAGTRALSDQVEGVVICQGDLHPHRRRSARQSGSAGA